MDVDPNGPIRRPGSAAKASETKRGTRPQTPVAQRSPDGSASEHRRNGLQRALLALGAAASATLLIVAGVLGYFNWRLGQINRVNLDLANAPAGGPQNYLVVGSDSRTGITADSPNAGAFLNANQYHSGSDDASHRSDTIMVLRIDPSKKTAQLLSLPRDLYVPIAGTGRKDKINSAFGIGVSTLIQTVQDNFDITINHYVEVDFVGFQKLVNAMGGVALYFDKPMWDSHTGLDIASVGCHALNGTQALAFARSRYLWYNTLDKKAANTSWLSSSTSTSQMHANGWHQDGTSDLGRISRQQLLIRTAIPQAEHAAFRNPATLNAIMDSVVHSVTVDSGLDSSNLLALANRFRKFNPEDLITYQYPSEGTVSPTAGSIQLPLEKKAEKILDNFRDQSGPPEHLVDVRVLNGSGVNSQAANVAGALQQVGFNVDSTGDASIEGIGDLDVSQVRYPKNDLTAAKLVASHLSAPVELVPVSGSSGSIVEVVTGSNFTTVTTKPRKVNKSELPASAPPTTANPGASSTTSTTVIGVVPDQVDTSCT